jgi:hypothetical protein
VEKGKRGHRKINDFSASPSASFSEGSDLTEWGAKGVTKYEEDD